MIVASRRFAWLTLVALVAATIFTVARMKRDYWDFEVYQVAGQRALAAAPLYRTEDLHYQFKYLPAFAMAMIPLAPLNPEVGKILWFAGTFVLVIAFVRRSTLALPARQQSIRLLSWITALLIGKYVVKELVNGQTNALLGWFLVMALLGTERKRPLVAGALAGAAVFVKPYGLIVLPWVLVSHGLEAVIAAIAALIAGLLLPAVVYGWTGNWQLLASWYHTVMGTTPENLLLGENISFATMWAKWIGPGPLASELAVATCVATIGLAAIVVWWRRRVDSPDYLELALLMLIVPVISPQGWDYVLLLGAPAIVLIVDRWPQLETEWQVLAGAALLVTSFSIFDLLRRRLYLGILHYSIETIGVVALVFVLMHIRRRALA